VGPNRPAATDANSGKEVAMSGRMATGMVLAGLVLAGGCGEEPKQIDSSSGAPREVAPRADLVARANPPIPDIPVPIGFKIDEKRSRNMEGGNARWVDHLYKGGADKFAVWRFYEQQMPVKRWTMQSVIFSQGDVTMDFRKDTESCRILISDGGWLDDTQVQIMAFRSGPIQSARR
jgi:hypothetical protein